MMNSLFNPDIQSEDLDSKIIVSLERLSQVFKISLLKESTLRNLSPIQIQTLIFLKFHDDEKKTLTQLAMEFDITKATMSDAIRVLKEKKLVKRVVNPADSRSALLKLTTTGEKVTEEVSLYIQNLKDTLAQFDINIKANVFSFLTDLIYELWRKRIISVQRMCFTCRYLRTDENENFFCNLLNKHLSENELRVDCPEHELK